MAFRRNYSRRYSGRYRPYRRSTRLSTRPYSRYRYTRSLPNSKFSSFRNRYLSTRPYYRRSLTNRTTPSTTNRWGNRSTSRYSMKKVMELKKQTNYYETDLSSSTNYIVQTLSELVTLQGVTQEQIIGRKVYQKYHNLRVHLQILTDQVAFAASMKIRVVLAWRQNKIGETYGPIIGNPSSNQSILFNSEMPASLRIISPYINGNNGTYHVVYDKIHSINVYTNDTAVVNIFFDKNRPINLEGTGNAGEYHDGNRQYQLLFMCDQTIATVEYPIKIISEIGYYDP